MKNGLKLMAVFVTLDLNVGATTLPGPPVIALAPEAQTVARRGTAAFRVEADGAGPFFYQWRLNGTNLPPIITTVGGNGRTGYSGDGGMATNVPLNEVLALAIDPAGNLYFSEPLNNAAIFGGGRVRKIGTNGVIGTVARTAFGGNSGDGGPATNAAFLLPAGLAVDALGNLLIADSGNHRIRKVDSNGIITTFAGGGQGAFLDGQPATNVHLMQPNDVAIDRFGNVLIASVSGNRILKVDTNGLISTVAGNSTWNYSTDGIPATHSALTNPSAVAVDSFGQFYISDSGYHRVRKVGLDGIIQTIAGGGRWLMEMVGRPRMFI